MNFFFTTFEDTFLILPSLCMSRVKCDRCDETHAWEIDAGWLCWGVSLVIGGHQ